MEHTFDLSSKSSSYIIDGLKDPILVMLVLSAPSKIDTIIGSASSAIEDATATSTSATDFIVSAFFNIPPDISLGYYDLTVIVPYNTPTPPYFLLTYDEPNYVEIIQEDEVTEIRRVIKDFKSATSPDGLSWEKAYGSIKEAMDDLEAVGGGEIWVAKGTYYPGGPNRDDSFEMKPDIDIYGGFNGDETARDDRDPESYETIFSGNIGDSHSDDDNLYHVLVGADDCILDGVTIREGYADGEQSNRHGGGIYLDSDSNMVINNCKIIQNDAEEGGGIYSINSFTIISNCQIENNTANNGGAILSRYGSQDYIIDSEIKNNEAEWRGGGIYIDYGANPAVHRTLLDGNRTDGNGGGVYIDDLASQLGGTKPVFFKCEFSYNHAGFRGGGLNAFNKSCTPKIFECVFTNNICLEGGGAIALDYYSIASLFTISYSSNSGGSGPDDIHDQDEAVYFEY